MALVSLCSQTVTSGCDGEDRPLGHEAVEAAAPGDGLGIFVVIFLAQAIPVASSFPGSEGVAVDGAALPEQHEQLGLVFVAGDQCPGAHGAAVHAAAEAGHVRGGDGGSDGGGGHDRFPFG